MRDPGATADMTGMISTEYLERCLQKCSLNNNNNSVVVVEGDFSSSSSSAESPENYIMDDQSSSIGEETTLDLNSHISLPLHWERCLDLKSGEIYYINWRTGKKVWAEDHLNSNMYSSPISSYDGCSEESNSSAGGGGISSLSSSSSSSASSSCFSSRDHQCNGGEEYRIKKNKSKSKKNKKKTSKMTMMMMNKKKKMEILDDHEEEEEEEELQQQVLVVAGCKNCFMYFMVPRLVQDCPKCFTQLLHFDHDEPQSSPS